MPTYVIIKFIKDYKKSEIKNVRGRLSTVWKILIKVGKKRTMHFKNASKFVRDGYAIYSK